MRFFSVITIPHRYATARHTIVVIKLDPRRPASEKEKVVIRVTDHKAPISYILWDPVDERFFSADDNGFLFCTRCLLYLGGNNERLDLGKGEQGPLNSFFLTSAFDRVSMSIRNKLIPELSTELILHCQTSITQLDLDSGTNRLLVCNLQRVVLLNLHLKEHGRLTQIGPERCGKFGACFDRVHHELRHVLMALPSGAIAKVDSRTGDTVHSVLPALGSVVVSKIDNSEPSACGRAGALSFEYVYHFGTYVVMHGRNGYSLMDGELGEVLACHVTDQISVNPICLTPFRNHSLYILHNRPKALLSLGRLNAVRCVDLLLACGETALPRCTEVAWMHQITEVKVLEVTFFEIKR